MFELSRLNRSVKQALTAIARQHVTMILPGNVPVIENSPPRTEQFEAAVLTAHIRGWMEILHEGTPTGQLEFQAGKPILPDRLERQTHYRLTDAGWAVIHNTQTWIIATFVVSLLALLASIVAVVVTWPK